MQDFVCDRESNAYEDNGKCVNFSPKDLKSCSSVSKKKFVKNIVGDKSTTNPNIDNIKNSAKRSPKNNTFNSSKGADLYKKI